MKLFRHFVILFVFLGLLESFSYACETLKAQIERYLGVVDVPLNYDRTHLFPPNIAVRDFEHQIAIKSGLNLESIIALVRNFTLDFTKDGSINVFREDHNLFIDTSVNLTGAYIWGKANLKFGEITPQDIIEIRKKSMEVFIKNKGRNLTYPEMSFKNQDSVAKVGRDIHPETIQKLKLYNFQVTPTETGYDIRYGNEINQIRLLTEYCQNLNQIMRSQAPPELITAYAVQDLLIRHVFADGNGRTSRLLGQLIFSHYTGREILFPENYHREMNYTTQELANMIRLNN